MLVWLVLLSFILTLTGGSLAPPTLKRLLVVYRHGERTPVLTCPSDANTARFLEAGVGQLTVEGMRMHYELGGYLRQRYSNFLHSRYHPNFTTIRSANYDRTLMSAEANLAALYPPHDDEIFADKLRWRPIPVHTRPLSEDYELEFPDACAKYRQLLEQLKKSPEIERVLRKYHATFEYIGTHCGVPVKTLEDGMFVFDLLDIERRMNLTLPSWATDYVPALGGRLFPDLLADVYRRSFDMLSYTGELRRLGGGALLADLIRHMNASVTHSDTQRQLFVYSGHDSDLAALQATMGVYNDVPPPLASCMMFELHRSTEGAYFVNILYRNDTTQSAVRLVVPECGQFDCPWTQFAGHFQSLVPSDIEAECHVSAGSLTARDSTLIALAVLMALLLTVIAAFGATRRCRLCSSNSYDSLSTLVN